MIPCRSVYHNSTWSSATENDPYPSFQKNDPYPLQLHKTAHQILVKSITPDTQSMQRHELIRHSIHFKIKQIYELSHENNDSIINKQNFHRLSEQTEKE